MLAQQRIADRLASQRDAAGAAAALDPLKALPPPPPPPKPAAPDPGANRVVVDAAPSPAPPPSPVLPGISAVPAVPELVTSGPLPTLAGAPPPLAVGLGSAVLPAPPDPPPVANAAQAAVPVTLVMVAFTPGSDELPPSAPLNLRRFALAHKGVALTVTGHGGVVLPTPDSQSRALDLALRRAQAIAASLATAGIPAANLHVRAEAAGQGGTASL